MRSKNRIKGLDRPLFETIGGAGKKDTDFGIEIELEGTVEPINPTHYWVSKPDTSLRNGWEYVLIQPVSWAALPDALVDLQKILVPMKPKTTIRTSTHIHINVLRLTLREIFQATFFYYLIEELLVRTQGVNRVGNLFCLRMRDSKTVYHSLRDEIQKKSYFFGLHADACKYGALNLATVTSIGSLEFRFLEAMTASSDIKRWCTILYDVVHEGSKMSCKEMLDEYDDLPVRRFLKKHLAGHEFLWENFTADSLNDLLHTNYDSLRELSRAMIQTDFYSTPNEFWDPDQEEKPEPYPWSIQDYEGEGIVIPDVAGLAHAAPGEAWLALHQAALAGQAQQTQPVPTTQPQTVQLHPFAPGTEPNTWGILDDQPEFDELHMPDLPA